MPDFNGTIEVKHNPATLWETYSHTFENSADVKSAGYFSLKLSQRAEGGFHRALFSIRAAHDFLSDFVESSLGRAVRVMGNDGALVWEGYIHDMEFDAGRGSYKVDIGEMANAVWVRYRIRGASTTSRSTVAIDQDSIDKYGRREFVLSGGELENTIVADAIAQQYLDTHSKPRPTPTRIDPEKELADYPTVSVNCRGWFDTLDWRVYNQTSDTDSQGASAQVIDVLGGVGQFVKSRDIETNATIVGREYDADRRGGAIIKDVARLGDSNSGRWVAYMTDGRTFVFEKAAPPFNP